MNTKPLEKAGSTARAPDPRWLRLVRAKAETLRYGAIHLTIHDGRVTQIESIEKTRFPATDPDPRPEPE